MLKKWHPYILLSPLMLVLAGLFFSGLFMGMLQSFGYFPVIGLREFTWHYYRVIITDTSFLYSLSFSLRTSFISSVISVILGILLAYAIFENKNYPKIQEAIYKLPIIIPHIVAVLLVISILGQSGILARLLFHSDIITAPAQFPSLLFDRAGIGVIIAYIWKGFPFITLIVYTVLSNLDNRLAEVALNLGASKWRVFFHILLPLMIPAVSTAFVFIFAFSFGAFEVPFLLGPTVPKALPVKAYIEYINPDLASRPYAMAINMLLAFISMLLIWLYHYTTERKSKYNRWLK